MNSDILKFLIKNFHMFQCLWPHDDPGGIAWMIERELSRLGGMAGEW